MKAMRPREGGWLANTHTAAQVWLGLELRSPKSSRPSSHCHVQPHICGMMGREATCTASCLAGSTGPSNTLPTSLWGGKSGHLGQWSPGFLAPGTGFMEDNFSTHGDG